MWSFFRSIRRKRRPAPDPWVPDPWVIDTVRQFAADYWQLLEAQRASRTSSDDSEEYLADASDQGRDHAPPSHGETSREHMFVIRYVPGSGLVCNVCGPFTSDFVHAWQDASAGRPPEPDEDTLPEDAGR